MLKYKIDLNADIDTFVNQFSKCMYDLFDDINIIVNSDNQTCVSVLDSSNTLLLYFYVVNTIYANRNTLLIKTQGLNVSSVPYNREDYSDWGPQIIYKNSSNELCSRAGFITSATQKFIVDSLIICLDDNGTAKNFISFCCNEYNQPLFIISPTNLGNVGIIGLTTNNANTTGMRTLVYDNNRTNQHNLNNLQITDSSVTSLVKLFVPESINGEYFEYVYIINSLETIEDELLKYDNHIYARGLNDKLALLIY